LTDAVRRDAEVAIVGGGVVGAALALLLVRKARVAARDIVIIERERPQPPQSGSAFDLRVSALSPANQTLLSELGVWQQLDHARVAHYERMVVWHESAPPDSPDTLCFDAAEMGEPWLGCVLENRALQAALLSACVAAGIEIREAALQGLHFDNEQATLNVGGTELRAQLVVGADGAASGVREAAHMDTRIRDYGQRAIVATVRGSGGHRATAWQCFLATGPLALLPLASGDCSIVWSAVEQEADRLMALSVDDFNAALTIASDGVLGPLQLQGERVSFPLRRVEASRYVAPHCVLVGDAAHVIHPLAGQGVNQGLQDAAALVHSLSLRPPRESVAAARALHRYERERRSGNALMGAVVDGFDQAFTRQGGAAAWFGREALSLANRSLVAKRFFFTRAAAGQSSPRR
jgi:2-polyprenylphenol 6-hydroxylase